MIAKNKNNDKSLKQINKKSFTTIDAVVEEFVNITNLLPSHGFKNEMVIVLFIFLKIFSINRFMVLVIYLYLLIPTTLKTLILVHMQHIVF